jgi:hypothetical protein
VAEFFHFSMTSSQKQEGEQAELTVLELCVAKYKTNSS